MELFQPYLSDIFHPIYKWYIFGPTLQMIQFVSFLYHWRSPIHVFSHPKKNRGYTLW